MLSCAVTPFSGSLRLDSGPTERVVRLGTAAAKILVSQSQISTLTDRASLKSNVSDKRFWHEKITDLTSLKV